MRNVFIKNMIEEDKGVFSYEKNSNIKYKKFKTKYDEWWMWRMSDILPICLQNILWSSKSTL